MVERVRFGTGSQASWSAWSPRGRRSLENTVLAFAVTEGHGALIKLPSKKDVVD